jgi:hypothetical protein
MNIRALRFAIPVLAVAALPLAAHADPIYSTEAAAQAACGADEVVWINLDRSKFYHKTQADFGKSSNGVYTCQKGARAHGYREAKDATVQPTDTPTSVAAAH